MLGSQLAAQLRKCQERLKTLSERSDFLPLNCALFRCEGGGATLSSFDNLFSVTLAGYVSISQIHFGVGDGVAGFAFYTDAKGATPESCQTTLTRVESITNELERIIRQLPRHAQDRLALPERGNWWRNLFHLAWHFPRPFFRAGRRRLLTTDGKSFSPVDETSIQLFGSGERRDLFPGVIYSDFHDRGSAPDLCECTHVAIDVVLDALKSEP